MNRFGPGDPYQMETRPPQRIFPPRILYDRNFEPIRRPPFATHFPSQQVEIRPHHNHVQAEMAHQRIQEIEQMRMRESECWRKEMELFRTEEIENQWRQELEHRRLQEIKHVKTQEIGRQWNEELDHRRLQEMELVRIQEVRSWQREEIEHGRIQEMEHLRTHEIERQWNQELDHRRLQEMEFVRIQEVRSCQREEIERRRMHEMEHLRTQEIESWRRLHDIEYSLQDMEYRRQDLKNHNYYGYTNFCTSGDEAEKTRSLNVGHGINPLRKRKKRGKTKFIPTKANNEQGNGNKKKTTHQRNSKPLQERNRGVTVSSQPPVSKKKSKSEYHMNTISTTVLSIAVSETNEKSQGPETNLPTQKTTNAQIEETVNKESCVPNITSGKEEKKYVPIKKETDVHKNFKVKSEKSQAVKTEKPDLVLSDKIGLFPNLETKKIPFVKKEEKNVKLVKKELDGIGKCDRSEKVEKTIKTETLASDIKTDQGTKSYHHEKPNYSCKEEKPDIYPVIKAEKSKKKGIKEKHIPIKREAPSSSKKLSNCSEKAMVVSTDKPLQPQLFNLNVPVSEVGQDNRNDTSSSKTDNLEPDNGELSRTHLNHEISVAPHHISECVQGQQNSNKVVHVEKKDEGEVKNSTTNFTEEKNTNKQKSSISPIIYDISYSKICDHTMEQRTLSSEKTMLTDTNSKNISTSTKTCTIEKQEEITSFQKSKQRPDKEGSQNIDVDSDKDSDKHQISRQVNFKNTSENLNALKAKILKSDKFDARMILDRRNENRKKNNDLCCIESTNSNCGIRRVSNRKSSRSPSTSDVTSSHKESSKYQKNTGDYKQDVDTRISTFKRNSRSLNRSTSNDATLYKSDRCHGNQCSSFHRGTSTDKLPIGDTSPNKRLDSYKRYRHRRTCSETSPQKKSDNNPSKKSEINEGGTRSSRTRIYSFIRDTSHESSSPQRDKGQDTISNKECDKSLNKRPSKLTYTHDKRSPLRDSDGRNSLRPRQDSRIIKGGYLEDSDSYNLPTDFRQRSRDSPDDTNGGYSSDDAEQYVSDLKREKKRERRKKKRSMHVDMRKIKERKSEDKHERISDSKDTDSSFNSDTCPPLPAELKHKESPVDFLLNKVEKSKGKLPDEISEMPKKTCPIDFLLKKFNEPINNLSTTEQSSEDITLSINYSDHPHITNPDGVLLTKSFINNNKTAEATKKPCLTETSLDQPNFKKSRKSDAHESSDICMPCDNVQICQDTNRKSLPTKLRAGSSKEVDSKPTETPNIKTKSDVKTGNSKKTLIVEYITCTGKAKNYSCERSLDQRINKFMETLSKKTSSADLPSSFIPLINDDKENKSFTDAQKKQNVAPISQDTMSICKSFSIDFSKCETFLSPNSLNLMPTEHFVYDKNKNDISLGKLKQSNKLMQESKQGRSLMNSFEESNHGNSSDFFRNKEKDYLSIQKSDSSKIASKQTVSEVKGKIRTNDSIKKMLTDTPSQIENSDLNSTISLHGQDQNNKTTKKDSTHCGNILLPNSAAFVDSSPDVKDLVIAKTNNSVLANDSSKTSKSTKKDSIHSKNNLPHCVSTTCTYEYLDLNDHKTTKTSDRCPNNSVLSESCSSINAKCVTDDFKLDEKDPLNSKSCNPSSDSTSFLDSIKISNAVSHAEKDIFIISVDDPCIDSSVIKAFDFCVDSDDHIDSDKNLVKKNACNIHREDSLLRAPGRGVRKYASQFCEIMSKHEAEQSSTADSVLSVDGDEPVADAPSNISTQESIAARSHLLYENEEFSLDINITPEDSGHKSKIMSECVKSVSPKSNIVPNVISRPTSRLSLRKYADIFCKNMALYEEQTEKCVTSNHDNETENNLENTISSDHDEHQTSVCEEEVTENIVDLDNAEELTSMCEEATTKNMANVDDGEVETSISGHHKEIDLDNTEEKTSVCEQENTAYISNLDNDIAATSMCSFQKETNSEDVLKRTCDRNNDIIETNMRPTCALLQRETLSEKKDYKMNKQMTSIEIKTTDLSPKSKAIDKIIKDFPEKNRERKKEFLIRLKSEHNKIKGKRTKMIYLKGSEKFEKSEVFGKPEVGKNLNSKDVCKCEEQTNKGTQIPNKNTVIGSTQITDTVLKNYSRDITKSAVNASFTCAIDNSVTRTLKSKPIARRHYSELSSSSSTILESFQPLQQDLSIIPADETQEKVISRPEVPNHKCHMSLPTNMTTELTIPLKEHIMSEKTSPAKKSEDDFKFSEKNKNCDTEIETNKSSKAVETKHKSNLTPSPFLKKTKLLKSLPERKKSLLKVNYDCDFFSNMDKCHETKKYKVKKRLLNEQYDKSTSFSKHSLINVAMEKVSPKCTEKRKRIKNKENLHMGKGNLDDPSSFHSKNFVKWFPSVENSLFGSSRKSENSGAVKSRYGKLKLSCISTVHESKLLTSISSEEQSNFNISSTFKKKLRKSCFNERKEEVSRSYESISHKTQISNKTERPSCLKKVSKFSKKNFLKLKTLKDCKLKKDKRKKKLCLLKVETIKGNSGKKSLTTNNSCIQRTRKWKRIKIQNDQETMNSDAKERKKTTQNQNISHTISRSQSCPETNQLFATPQRHRRISKGRLERQNFKYKSDDTSQKDGSVSCSSYSQGTPSSSGDAATQAKADTSFSKSMSLDVQTNFQTPDKLKNETRNSLLLQKTDLEKFKKNLSKSPFLKNRLEKKKTSPEKDVFSDKSNVPSIGNDLSPAGLHSTSNDNEDLDSKATEIDVKHQISCIPSYSEVDPKVDVQPTVLVDNSNISSVKDKTATIDYDSDDSLCLRTSPCGGCVDLDQSDDDLHMEPIGPIGLTGYAGNEKQVEDTVSEVCNKMDDDGSSGPTSSKVSGTMKSKQGCEAAICLDNLLAEKEETEVKNRNLLLMQIELKEGIKRGGFVQVLQDVAAAEEELLPEQKKALETLQVFESEIKEVHPGEEVFHTRLFQQLFQQSLSPTDCSFIKGDSMIDALLSNVKTEMLADFLSSGVLTMCFHKVSCPEIICQWLFYTLSINRNSLVVHSCQRILMDLIQTQSADTPDLYTWCPKPLDLLKIFLNYGAEESFMMSDQHFYSKEEIRSTLQPSVSHQNSRDTVGLNLIGRDNFLGVLETLSFALQSRPELEREEVTVFIELLVRAAMDKSFNSNKCHYEFQVAISSALQCYDKSTWTDVIPDLCKRLNQVTKHHHNKVYLAQLLPPGSRGVCIQRRVAAMYLHEEITGKVMKSCPETIEIKSLFQYVEYMRGMIKELDFYKLSNCIVLMDLVVGVEKLTSEQKDHLVQLSEMISFLKGDLRDSVQMMDKTRVKDLMVRTSSKWTLMIQTMGCMQTNLFPWTKNKYVQEMKIERLEVESDQESELSDAEKTPTKSVINSVDENKKSVQETDNDNIQPKTTEFTSETSLSANNESQSEYACKDDPMHGSNQESSKKCVPICETVSETKKAKDLILWTESESIDKNNIETPSKSLIDVSYDDWGDELLNSDDDLLNSDDDSLPEL